MRHVNPIIDPKLITVNGPVNVIRLEGRIHGTDKVIYLFMDYHISVGNQTQCDNLFSDDVQKFLTNSFHALNDSGRTYDFFVEIYPTELADRRYQEGIVRKDYKEKYIEEVVKVFKKIFQFDTKKNKVSINKVFKNIRLHYLDIRDYFKNNIHEKVSEMVDIAHEFMVNDDIDVNNLNEIISLMEIMRDHLELVVEILSAANTNKSTTYAKIIKNKSTETLDIKALEYLTDKIRNSYNYADVKKVMNKLIDDTIKNFNSIIIEIDQTIDEFNIYADTLGEIGNKLVKDANTSYIYNYGLSSYTIRQMINNIVNKTESLIDEKFIEFFARFTDIYFLRRFLDKDYITNAIVYTGALHSNMYISILVKKFNFKVTNASYSKISNMTKLTNEIKKRSFMEIQELILPVKFQQCSDMTLFPKNFL